MVKPLDQFLRDQVRTLLKEKGFSKKGREFRMATPNGDFASINFRSYRLDLYEVEFLTEAGVHPRPWIEWKRDVLGSPVSSIAGPLWQKVLRSPFPYLESQFAETHAWVLNLDDRERITVFQERLSSLADKLINLVDRRNLKSTIEDPATPPQELFTSRDRSMAVLLVDEGSSRELDEVLKVLEAKNPDDNMASWVRVRLGDRSGTRSSKDLA